MEFPLANLDLIFSEATYSVSLQLFSLADAGLVMIPL
jgi:hypothetical protein